MNSANHNCTCGCAGDLACDCCTGPTVSTPEAIFNRPGQDSLARRAGTWSSFRKSMHAQLSNGRAFPALQKLTTREPDDPSIAFLDAAAVVCDALTFYTERLTNEGYLRTATQRRSLAELGRLVGYRPRPGVAASAWLAFTLDKDYAITIPRGTRVQSIPAKPDELPQTFETSGDLKARAELNAMKPRLSIPQEIVPANVLSIETIWLKGTGLNLKAGDMLLFVFPEDEDAKTARKIMAVIENASLQITRVDLVIEKLTAGFYRPILKQAAEAARGSVPDDWVKGLGTDKHDKWAKPLAEVFESIIGKLDEKKATLLSMHSLLVDGDPNQRLDQAVQIGVVGLLCHTELTQAKAWPGNQLAQWTATLGRAARQELLISNVLLALSDLDTTAGLDPKKAAAQRVADLFNTAADSDFSQCNVLVTAAGNDFKAAIPAAKAANSVPAFNTALAGARALFDKLGTGNEAIARADAKQWLEDRKRDAVSSTASLQQLLQQLLGMGAGTLQQKIDAAHAGGFTSLETLLQEISNALADSMIKRRAALQQLDQFLNPQQPQPQLPLPDDDSLSAVRSELVGLTNPGHIATVSVIESLKTLATGGAGPALLDALTKIGRIGDAAALLLLRLHEYQVKVVADFKSVARILINRYLDLRVSNDAASITCGNALNDFGIAIKNSATLDKLYEAVSSACTKIDAVAGPASVQRVRYLNFEIGRLKTGVDTAPSGATSSSGKVVSANAAALGDITEASVLLQPHAPGDPLAVERRLSNLKPESQSASDGLSRLAGRIAGATDDILFATWRKLFTGAPKVEVHVLRVQAPVFGHGAPFPQPMPPGAHVPAMDSDWIPRQADIGSAINIEGEHGGVVPGGYIVIERRRSPESEPAAKDSSIFDMINSPLIALSPQARFTQPVIVAAGLMSPATASALAQAATVTAFVDPDELETVPETLIYKVASSITRPHADYGISGKITRATLLPDLPWGIDKSLGFGVIRRAKVYAVDEKLTLADTPVSEDIGADLPLAAGDKPPTRVFDEAPTVVMLDGLLQGLAAGSRLIFAGVRVGSVSTRTVCEYALVTKVEHRLVALRSDTTSPLPGDTPHTLITLSKPLQYRYKRDTVVIYGNVAEATHGETKREVLGGGNARLMNQRFPLRSVPLTHVAAATSSGVESTARLRVDHVLWHETPEFIDAGPDDRVFVIDIADDGRTTAIFGDGRQGARLPTGAENVTAEYRQGMGRAGNVGAESLKTLLDRPLGLKEVINPLPASGGADRDNAEDIRRNAPLPLVALDRLVSVSDYAVFARAFAGIGKAESALLGSASETVLHVTIAGQADVPIAEDSALMMALTNALIDLGDPLLPVRVQVRELKVLLLEAGVRLLPDYEWASVEPVLRAALLMAFGFDRRSPGQDVFLSEVIDAMQRVPGVDFVDVDHFGAVPQMRPDTRDARRTLKPEELEEAIQAAIDGKVINWLKPTSDPQRQTPIEALSASSATPLAVNPPQRLPVDLAGYDELGALRPAQLAIFLPDMPETLTLNQLVP